MAFYDKFPYTNFQEINLDRIIKELMQVKEGLNFVIENASLKYANPIEWNITTQYQANTVVIDPATGIAYISTKPVPNNILITNTNYWTKIFDLSQLFDDLEASIASEAEARENADTALSTAIQSETEARENADTALTNAIQAETDARIAEDTRLSARIEEVANATIFINVKEYGAVGDGVTDDTAALNAAFAAVGNEKSIVYFPPGTYMINDYVDIKSFTYVIGAAGAIVKTQRTDSTYKKAGFTLGESGNSEYATAYNGVHDVIIENIIFDGGYNDTFTGTNNGGGNMAMAHCENVTVRECTFQNFVNDHCIDVAGCRHVIIENCIFKNTAVTGTNDYEAINIDSASHDGFPHFGYWDNTPCYDIRIEGNVFRNLKTYAKCIGTHYLPEGGLVHRKIKIINNDVRECSALVYTRKTYDMIISGNELHDCGYYDTAQQNRFAIYCRECTGLQITGNTMRDIKRGGIKLESTDGTYTENVIIANNFLYNINQEADTSFGHTIRTNNVQTMSITDNILAGNSRITNIENCTTLMFANNIAYGSFDKPFGFYNSSKITATMNRSMTTNAYDFNGCTDYVYQGNSQATLTAVA